MKILLIDPDEYYHHQLREKLSEDFELVAGRSLAEAKTLAVQHEPDMIVSEMLFADGPAFDFFSEMTSRGPESTPVIVFSEVKNLEDVQEALARGASGYFVKGQDTIHDVYQLLLSLNS